MTLQNTYFGYIVFTIQDSDSKFFRYLLLMINDFRARRPGFVRMRKAKILVIIIIIIRSTISQRW